MERRPIESGIDDGRRPDSPGGPDPGVSTDVFRDALAEWASTVTVVAVRDGGDVHAMTATSFVPVTAEPPLVALALGPNARVLPFLDPATGRGAPFAVSLLAAGQRRIATVFADSFPVGPSPFPTDGAPVVREALLGLLCSVRSVVPVGGGARLVVARVEGVVRPGGEEPLLYRRRGYGRMAPDG